LAVFVFKHTFNHICHLALAQKLQTCIHILVSFDQFDIKIKSVWELFLSFISFKFNKQTMDSPPTSFLIQMAHEIIEYAEKQTPILGRMDAAVGLWQDLPKTKQSPYHIMDKERMCVIQNLNQLAENQVPNNDVADANPTVEDPIPTCFLTQNGAEILQYSQHHIICHSPFLAAQLLWLNLSSAEHSTYVIVHAERMEAIHKLMVDEDEEQPDDKTDDRATTDDDDTSDDNM
jgi:hypothetical protein